MPHSPRRYGGAHGPGELADPLNDVPGTCAEERCAHDFQWHPQSEDFGVCSKCGAGAPDELGAA